VLVRDHVQHGRARLTYEVSVLLNEGDGGTDGVVPPTRCPGRVRLAQSRISPGRMRDRLRCRPNVHGLVRGVVHEFSSESVRCRPPPRRRPLRDRNPVRAVRDSGCRGTSHQMPSRHVDLRDRRAADAAWVL